MKNWMYFTIAALLSFGVQSCRDEEEYSNELQEIIHKEDDNAAKLDALTKAQEELKQKQEELTLLQEELKKLQEQLGQQGSGSQDSTAVSQDQLLSEIKKMQDELASKLDDLAKAQEEIQKLQKELNEKENVDPTDPTNPTDPTEPADTTTFITPTPGDSVSMYDNPAWVAVEAEGDYAYSMTVVFELPSALEGNATSDDILAAFVGEECRAVATLSDGVFFLDVIGTGEEESPVTFRYWNAGNHYMYESLVSLPFITDFIYGVVDNPKTFRCKQK